MSNVIRTDIADPLMKLQYLEDQFFDILPSSFSFLLIFCLVASPSFSLRSSHPSIAATGRTTRRHSYALLDPTNKSPARHSYAPL